MSITQLTSSKYFMQLNVIYFALIIMQINSLIGFFLVFPSTEEDMGLNFFSTKTNALVINQQSLLIVSVIVLVTYFVSQYFYKKRLEDIKLYDSLTRKMTTYRAVFIVRIAIVQSAVVMSAVLFFVNSDKLMLVAFLILFLYFITLKPSKSKIIKDLELKSDEESQLNNPNEIIFKEKRNRNYD